MGTIEAYETARGKRYRVRYRRPDHRQTDKRGFRTKRDADLFLATVEVAKATGEYIDPGAGAHHRRRAGPDVAGGQAFAAEAVELPRSTIPGACT